MVQTGQRERKVGTREMVNEGESMDFRNIFLSVFLPFLLQRVQIRERGGDLYKKKCDVPKVEIKGIAPFNYAPSLYDISFLCFLLMVN